MVLLQQNTEQLKGKQIDCFTDEYGNKLDNLIMCESIVILFTDGTKLFLDQDWRGENCYISQYKTMEETNEG